MLLFKFIEQSATIAQPEPLLHQGSEKTNTGLGCQSDVLDSLFYLILFKKFKQIFFHLHRTTISKFKEFYNTHTAEIFAAV